jgi:hypothetical protein
MKKELKFHYSDPDLPGYTLCGKAIEASTGSPLNADGSVPASRVDAEDVTCKTCLASAEG